MEDNQIYRGVIEAYIDHRNPHKGTQLYYQKPYNKPGFAKATVTRWRNMYSKEYVRGWVEVTVEWRVLDD